MALNQFVELLQLVDCKICCDGLSFVEPTEALKVSR